MTENIQETIDALKKIEAELGLPSEKFARVKLKVSSAAWSRIKGGNYPMESGSRVAERLSTALDFMQEAQAAPDWKRHKWTVVRTSPLRAAMQGLREAMNETQNRLLVVLMPQGGGKTTFATTVLEEWKDSAAVAEATEPCRTSYMAALLVLCRAVGLKDEFHNPYGAQEALFARLRQRFRVLVIDEAHYLGPTTINLVKAILNQTNTSVAMLAIPSLWKKMAQAAWEESAQLRRRIAAKMVCDRVTESDAKLFLESRLKCDVKPFVRRVMESANQFGLYDTMEQVCKKAIEHAEGQAVGIDEIELAIKEVEALR